jgi:hypothetical protein
VAGPAGLCRQLDGHQADRHHAVRPSRGRTVGMTRKSDDHVAGPTLRRLGWSPPVRAAVAGERAGVARTTRESPEGMVHRRADPRWC